MIIFRSYQIFPISFENIVSKIIISELKVMRVVSPLLFFLVPMVTGLTGYQFQDNKSDQRNLPENGEMVFQLSSFPPLLAACFSIYIDFNRYSSIVPIMDFRTSYEEDSFEFFYGWL